MTKLWNHEKKKKKNCNRRTALEQLYKNYWGWVVGRGMVYKTIKSYLVRTYFTPTLRHLHVKNSIFNRIRTKAVWLFGSSPLIKPHPAPSNYCWSVPGDVSVWVHFQSEHVYVSIFHDFVLYFWHSCSPRSFWKGVYSKTKEFAPSGSKFFRFREDPFSEGRPKRFWQLPPLKVQPFPFIKITWIATSENVPSNMSAQRRFRSACAFAQPDQKFHRAHFGSQRCKVSSCGQRRHWSDCADTQADLSLCLAHVSKGTLSVIMAMFF